MLQIASILCTLHVSSNGHVTYYCFVKSFLPCVLPKVGNSIFQNVCPYLTIFFGNGMFRTMSRLDNFVHNTKIQCLGLHFFNLYGLIYRSVLCLQMILSNGECEVF